jgi:hypothetical protein
MQMATMRRTPGTSTTCRATAAARCATWRATSSSPASRCAATNHKRLQLLKGGVHQPRWLWCPWNLGAGTPLSMVVVARHPTVRHSHSGVAGDVLCVADHDPDVGAACVAAGAVAVCGQRAVGILLARGGPCAVFCQLPPPGRPEGEPLGANPLTGAVLSSSRRVAPFQALIQGALPLTDVGLATLQVWYGVPAHASEALEEAMADALPHLFDTAPNLIYQLVRHSF